MGIKEWSGLVWCSKCSILEKNSKRQISIHLTVLKHQNTKTSLLSSLKIIGFLHFLKFLDLLEKYYNPQSLMITLYIESNLNALGLSCL